MSEEISLNRKQKLIVILKVVLFAIAYVILQALTSYLIYMITELFHIAKGNEITLSTVCIILAQAIVILLFIHIYNKLVLKQEVPDKKAGGNKVTWLMRFLVGAFAGILIMAVLIGIRGLFGTISEFHFYSIISSFFLILGNFTITFSVAVLEEFCFRFTFYSSLKRMISSKAIPMIIVSLIFGICHLGNGVGIIDILFYFIFSIFLCMIVDKRKSIWGAVGFHTGWNFLADGGNIFAITYKQDTVEELLVLKLVIIIGILIAIILFSVIEKRRVKKGV